MPLYWLYAWIAICLGATVLNIVLRSRQDAAWKKRLAEISHDECIDVLKDGVLDSLKSTGSFDREPRVIEIPELSPRQVIVIIATATRETSLFTDSSFFDGCGDYVALVNTLEEMHRELT